MIETLSQAPSAGDSMNWFFSDFMDKITGNTLTATLKPNSPIIPRVFSDLTIQLSRKRDLQTVESAPRVLGFVAIPTKSTTTDDGKVNPAIPSYQIYGNFGGKGNFMKKINGKWQGGWKKDLGETIGEGFPIDGLDEHFLEHDVSYMKKFPNVEADDLLVKRIQNDINNKAKWTSKKDAVKVANRVIKFYSSVSLK